MNIAGFVIGSNVLIIAGALVGASGAILTKLMANAMNRSVLNIIAGGFGGGEGTVGETAGGSGGSVREVSADDVAIQLAYASKVIVDGAQGHRRVHVQLHFGHHQIGSLNLHDRGGDGLFQRRCLPVEMNPGHAVAARRRPVVATGREQPIHLIVGQLRDILQDDVEFVGLHMRSSLGLSGGPVRVF